MKVEQAIQTRRALRALSPLKITDELINELGKSAQFAPSCGNKQPWRYVFVYDPIKLNELHETLSGGNYWAKKASMIIAACAKRDNDCVIGNREYYLFDLGLATGFILLRATELGLVTHPMAGFDQQLAKKILDIPQEVTLITLIAVSNRAESTEMLSNKHAKAESVRPSRFPLKDIIFENTYK